MSRDEPLGLGLIGCGSFGMFCLEAFSAMDEVRLVAASRARRPDARKLCDSLGVQVVPDPAELIARNDIDIIHVATPPGYHHDTVIQALQAGKHVLCEKPLAVKPPQPEEMIAAARKARRCLTVNFILRYNPVTEAVKAILDSEVLGAPLAARLTNCAGDTPLRPDHWFWNKSISGGIFIEHGLHFFDLYEYWLGPGEVISAHAETRPPTNQEDRVTCTVRHETSVLATHYHGFDQVALMDRTDHRIICEMGDILIKDWVPTRVIIDGAVDDTGAVRLSESCPGCSIETTEQYRGQRDDLLGRGKTRSVTWRVRLEYCPTPDKQSLYADSARALLADQIAHIRDPDHTRKVTEANGLASLILAEAAERAAQGG